MLIHGWPKRPRAGVLSMLFLLFVGCSDDSVVPLEPPEGPNRRLQLAIDGETGVSILVNGDPVNDPNLARRLHVEIIKDSATLSGNLNNKKIQSNVNPVQADSVEDCLACEVNVIYHDSFGGVPTNLDPFEGVLADGDYTVKLFRDGSTLVSSKAIAVNHANHDASNGSFLDEANDQIVTFYLNQNLQQISAPTVDVPHSRALNHLTAGITRPSAADTTIEVGQVLSVKGSAANGLSGKKYAWDWNASGTNLETFDTEFSSSNVATHSWSSEGDFKIRLIVRDGNDDVTAPPRGGHYAISTTKTVHVVEEILDSATAEGALLPFTMTPNSVASVGFVMDNSGSTTWSNAAGYSFDLHRDGVWLPLADTLDHTVPPGTGHSFTFNLLAPNDTGFFACFYRMNHSGFFGQENGRDILVCDCGSFSATGSEDAVTAQLSFDPARKWLVDATRRGPRPLVLPGLVDEGVDALEYTYHHPIPHAIDVAFKFVFDPAIVVPAPPRIGVAGLKHEFGLRGPGEYWVRITGTVPKGEGMIAAFPFLSVQSEKASAEPGSFMLYELTL